MLNPWLTRPGFFWMKQGGSKKTLANNPAFLLESQNLIQIPARRLWSSVENRLIIQPPGRPQGYPIRLTKLVK
jgi:hypothetical protein